jgi:hypothetical protein
MSPPDTDLPASGASADRGADSMLQRALTLIEQSGALIFPLHHVIGGRCSCGNDECKSVGKHPIERGWQRDASASELVVRAWWARHPHASIGLLTGQRAGIVVIDVDGAVGLESLRAIEARYGALPLTPRVITSRGIHLYFIYPSDATDGGVRNNASAIAPGIDVRGNGGYVVAPGSVHESGHVYAWVAGCELGALPVAELPEWAMANDVLGLAPSPTLLPPPPTAPTMAPRISVPSALTTQALSPEREAKRRRAYALRALDGELAKLRLMSEGNRNDTLNTAIFNMALLAMGGVLDADTVIARIVPIARERGLGEREVRATVMSAFAGAGKREPRYMPPVRDEHVSRARLVAAAAVNGHATTPEPAGPPAPVTRAYRWTNPDVLFAPLPPAQWAVPALQMGAGRPTAIVAYGASGKTLMLQSLALGVATGTPVWGHFECQPLRVCHLDYEQGLRDTAYRYQRLALGHGIDPRAVGGRLHVSALPDIFLTDSDIADALEPLADAHDLILIDSLRAACPGVDENDSNVRRYVDVLTRVSEATGAAFVFLHHSGKNGGDARRGGARDARQLGRGSSAIFDGCGAVFNVELDSDSGSDVLRRVSMAKAPASSVGGAVPSFGLRIVDVLRDGDTRAGVAVQWEAVATPETEQAAEHADANAAYERDAARLLAAVQAAPGSTTRAVRIRARMKHGRVSDVLGAMSDDGLIYIQKAKRGANTYWPVKSNEQSDKAGEL